MTSSRHAILARLAPFALAAASLPLAAQQPDFAWARVSSPFDDAEARSGASFESAGVSVASDDLPLRSSLPQPREQIEATAQAGFRSGALSGRLRATFAGDFDGDLQEGRLDGSYVAAQAGNWIAAIDKIDRWWGPGWDGSLILSNNARPVPAVSLQRAEALPFENKFLSWIGPWSIETFMGKLESDRVVPNALLWGMRVELEPIEGLEIGLSRTAQWAGKGRPHDLDTFFKLLVGSDNVGSGGLTADTEPGNQLSGIDVRYELPNLPFAVYTQWIGEDEAGKLPYKFMTQLGAEWRGRMEGLGFDFVAYSEYSDTKAGDDFNTAYAHSVYQTGYRYRGQSLGHAIDSDGIMRSVGVFLENGEGLRLGAKLKDATLNRDGAGLNSVSVARSEQTWIELFASVSLEACDVAVGLSGARIRESDTGASRNELGGFLALSRPL